MVDFFFSGKSPQSIILNGVFIIMVSSLPAVKCIITPSLFVYFGRTNPCLSLATRLPMPAMPFFYLTFVVIGLIQLMISVVEMEYSFVTSSFMSIFTETPTLGYSVIFILDLLLTLTIGVAAQTIIENVFMDEGIFSENDIQEKCRQNTLRLRSFKKGVSPILFTKFTSQTATVLIFSFSLFMINTVINKKTIALALLQSLIDMAYICAVLGKAHEAHRSTSSILRFKGVKQALQISLSVCPI